MTLRPTPTVSTILHATSILPAFMLMIACICISAPTQAAPANDHARYQECTRNALSEPKNAYKLARAWYGTSGSLAAQHCMVMALFTMRDYPAAANHIESMLKTLSPTQGTTWLTMKTQAVQAYLAAKNFDAALTHADDAIAHAADTQHDGLLATLLTLRADIYAQRESYLRAIQDLDHAFTIQRTNDIRLKRASFLLKMGDKTGAIADLDAIIATDPEHTAALQMRQHISQ